jgi:hypothetical protein
MEQENELELLQKTESIVGSDTIPHMEETRLRLLSLISQTEVGLDKLITRKEGKKEGLEESSDEPMLGLQPQWSSSLITAPEVGLYDRVKMEVTPQVTAEPLRPLKKRFYPQAKSRWGWHATDDNCRHVPTATALTPVGAESMDVDSVFRRQTDSGYDAKVAIIEAASVPQIDARQVSTLKQATDKEPIVIKFHCPYCDKDYEYTSPKTATASFSNHLRRCGRKNQKTAMATPDEVPSRLSPHANHSQQPPTFDVAFDSAGKGSYPGETRVKVDDTTPAHVRNQVDPHELTIGSEVFVQRNKGQEWIATILLPFERSGEYGFYIRYKGHKRRRKVTNEEWVPAWRVLRVCPL